MPLLHFTVNHDTLTYYQIQQLIVDCLTWIFYKLFTFVLPLFQLF